MRRALTARRAIGRGWLIAAAVEVVAAIAIATGAIALLQSTAPAAGLGIVYLLAVLTLAIRRGEIPALITSILSVLTLNYLFITPRYELQIGHSQDVVELAVLLIAAVVVGRLASVARRRAGEAEDRALLATAHKREAELLADTAAAIVATGSLDEQLERVGRCIAAACGAERARVVLDRPASPQSGEEVVTLPSRRKKALLYLSSDGSHDRELVRRLATPIAGLIDVAVEREEVAERSADAEAASRAEVAKTAILHAISHDLRSPITAVATAASALRTSQLSDADRAGLIAAIESESARLARLVGDLLDLSRIEAGAVAPQPDWCDVADVAMSAAGRFHHTCQIVFNVPSDLPLVRVDAVQLERVFSNLIENAVKFSASDSPVEITGGAGPAWVTIRVVDSGPGIPREQRRHIFEPFFRGRRGGSGSGLGLAICRGFVEANGGRIVVQSNAGSGTSFAVSFPIPAEPVAPEPDAVSGAARR
jgi:two-component system, OmpR family, sensor histidine kinase KdpD